MNVINAKSNTYPFVEVVMYSEIVCANRRVNQSIIYPPIELHANYSNICLLADLNLDCMVESKCEPIRDLCDKFDFEQLIKQPTNLTIHGETLIYVILCSNPSLCLKSGVKYTGLSDSHSMVYHGYENQSRHIASQKCDMYVLQTIQRGTLF